MEINTFIENFASQFDETDIKEFEAATEFKQLEEWSSLIALSVIGMIDEEYDVVLRGDDIQKSKTIEDLFNIVKAQI